MYARARTLTPLENGFLTGLITFFVFIFLFTPSLSHAAASVISQYTGIAEPYAASYGISFDIAEPSTFIATGTLTTLSLPAAPNFTALSGSELFSIRLKDFYDNWVDCQTPEKTADAWGITRTVNDQYAPFVTFGPFSGTQCAIERNDSGSQDRRPFVMESGGLYANLGVMGTGYRFNFTAYGPDVPDPPLCTLTASPTSVTLGDSSTLSWTTTNATAFTLDNSIGAVTPVASSSTLVSATTTTTYTGTATGAGGTVACSAILTVNPVPPPPPPPPAPTSSSPGAISIPYIPPPVAPVVEAPAQAPVATVVSQSAATPTVTKAVPKVVVAKKKPVVKPVVVPIPIVEEIVEAPVAIVVEQPKRVIPPIPQTASVYDAVSAGGLFSEKLIDQIYNYFYIAILLALITALISFFRHRSRLKIINEQTIGN